MKNINFNSKKAVAAALVSVMLFTACSGGDEIGDESGGAKTSDIAPSEAVSAVLAEVPISSAVEKGTFDVGTYYAQVDTSELDMASFSLCGSGGVPDEIAVLKFKTEDAAKAAETGLQARLDERIELFRDYAPDEMYKLDTAKIYSLGNYAVLLALSDNEKAQSIVDEKLKG